MACFSGLAATVNPSSSLNFFKNPMSQFLNKSHSLPQLFTGSNNIKKIWRNGRMHRDPFFSQCTQFGAHNFVSETESDYKKKEEYSSAQEYAQEEEEQVPKTVANWQIPPPVKRQRRRYRKQCPGENKGITEEMRFVAMKLRNSGKIKKKYNSAENGESEKGETKSEGEKADDSEKNDDDEIGGRWQPSMEGFLKYLVDSKLVFTTVERIVDESNDVTYVYFRKTGLERSDCISRDLEWLCEQGNDIPLPSNPGITYARYLEQLAATSPPLFLCHLYNIYFSHLAGGQVIAKQVSEKLLEGRELAFYTWEGDEEELLRGVREKLNALGEQWSRNEKNKCLRETTKAFRFLGQIVRLIIL